MRTTPVLLSASLAGLLLLTGCTSGSDDAPSEPAASPLPAESAFAEGTCSLVAPDVIAVGGALPRLGEGGVVDQAVKDELKLAQDQLFAVAETAEPELKGALDDLVVKIGIVRIRAVGNTYETVQGEGLRTSYDAVVDACT